MTIILPRRYVVTMLSHSCSHDGKGVAQIAKVDQEVPLILCAEKTIRSTTVTGGTRCGTIIIKSDLLIRLTKAFLRLFQSHSTLVCN
jgi:hypothetical protein